MRDRRQIQTAVLGSAKSDDPLMLPLEAIELDAFRHRHQQDTFWCGVLLGGCGGQLTTKLYTDRVCHFAHHPDPSGRPHECSRRARDVASADHLYVKHAAAAWSATRGHQPRFHFPQLSGAPIGSVVDIAWEHHGRTLRVHLGPAVPPVWDDDGVEPVLGVGVPVDEETLVRRWYVHRIRLDSAGTARHVRIGTEAFARPATWFTLDQCEMTAQGFRTPAVERIIRARRKPPPRHAATGRSSALESKAHEPDLKGRLEAAMRSGSVAAVAALCRDIKSSGAMNGDHAAQVESVLQEAQQWLGNQARQRQELFDRLDAAVRERKTSTVRALLAQADGTAGSDRSRTEDAVAHAAVMFLEEQKRAARWEHRDAAPPVRGPKLRFPQARAARPPQQPAAKLSAPRRGKAKVPASEAAAHRRMRDILWELRLRADKVPELEVRALVQSLTRAAAAAGSQVTPAQRKEVDRWVARPPRRRPAPQPQAEPAAAAPAGQTADSPSHPARPGKEQAVRRQQAASAPRTDRSGRRQPAKAASGPDRLPADAMIPVADAVRGALKKAARERTTTSWSRLRRQLGSALPVLHPDDRVEVLAHVDAKTVPAEPLLSALIAVNDTSSPKLYQRLAARLGRDVPLSPLVATSQWQKDVLALHQLYRYR